MQIELKSIKIADLIDGYVNDPDTGVKGYHGKLDIRPPYQREFRYDEKQQQAVIDTILKGFPLNIMYWSVDDNGNFEMIDGQQRTLSICGFYTHDFNIVDHDRGTLYFSTLTAEEKEKFLNYELTVYFCEGTDKEKLDWFRVINIAGEKLLDQELLNAVYSGPFVTDARRHFSKNGYVVAIVDNTNKGSEAKYWTDDFLHVRSRKDSFNQTQNMLSLCKSFVSQMPNVNGKIGKATFMNRSVKALKEESVNFDDFAEQVFETPKLVSDFKHYKEIYQKERDIEIDDTFETAPSAIKRRATGTMTTIKLDKNFDINIHGGEQYVVRGYDEVRGMYYYQLFFKEER